MTFNNYGAASMMLGGLTSAVGQYMAGQTERRFAEYNARQLDAEADRLGLEASETLRRRRRENQRILGTQKAVIAKSGVAMGEGSPLEALAENAALLEMDALDEKRATEIERKRLWHQARIQVAQGKAASKAGKIGAVSSLLSGVGGGAASWKR